MSKTTITLVLDEEEVSQLYYLVDRVKSHFGIWNRSATLRYIIKYCRFDTRFLQELTPKDYSLPQNQGKYNEVNNRGRVPLSPEELAQRREERERQVKEAREKLKHQKLLDFAAQFYNGRVVNEDGHWYLKWDRYVRYGDHVQTFAQSDPLDYLTTDMLKTQFDPSREAVLEILNKNHNDNSSSTG